MTAPEPERRRAELRRAAEARLRAYGAEGPEMGLDRVQLIQELQVHQVELEMQNEELLNAHAETARSSVRYQRLYDLTPVGCVTMDRTGRVRDGNLRAAMLLGVGRADLDGQPLQKFMPELAADVFHRHLRSVFTGSAKRTCKVVMERHGAKTGSFPVRIDSILVPDETGSRMLCQSVLINLSEFPEAPPGLRTSEAPTTAERAADALLPSEAAGEIESLPKPAEGLDSLREQRDFAERLLATAPVLVLVLDLDGRIVQFNRCLEDITGYHFDEVRGADWVTTFLPDEDHEQSRAAFMRTLWGEIAPAAIHPIRTKRGSKVEIEWHNAVLRGAGGNVCAALSIGLDVTKRRQVEGSRRLATVGEFAAGVAREITNPVDTIVNCAMLLLDGSPVSDNCRIILDEGARISGIGKHLLQFTRGARGAPQPTSLAEVVGRAVRLLGEEFERHGIRLQVEVPRDLPPVLAHPQQLQQVLLNLLTNAKDAFQLTWTGSRLVTVRAGVDDGTTVSCCVRDNGPGIARDLATHIFEPFMTTNRERGGAGLGLFVSRSIIESFGGRLTVQSVPGEFAEFTLELPQTANY